MKKSATIDTFIQTVWAHYDAHKRAMPWREPDASGAFDPYKILISEIMLQQTQVHRVVPKFNAFITAFPTLDSLSQASLQDVLKLWSGLGYNRRAKYLLDCARALQGSVFPRTSEELTTYKGIGPNTAAAILVYSFNLPLVFIETNIRTAYIHHFYSDTENVDDKDIEQLVAQTLDMENPREWYWALMDYGSMLKQSGTSHNAKSKQYTKQSSFLGSDREIRGKIIKLLVQQGRPMQLIELEQSIQDKRLLRIAQQLEQEQLIKISKGSVSLS